MKKFELVPDLSHVASNIVMGVFKSWQDAHLEVMEWEPSSLEEYEQYIAHVLESGCQLFNSFVVGRGGNHVWVYDKQFKKRVAIITEVG